jgi:hypothetical protein
MISGLYMSKMFFTAVVRLLRPPKTEAPSVNELEAAIAGSLKWRERTVL